MNIFYY